MSGFKLDNRLAKDTAKVCDLDLCYVGLMKDSRYPWLVLVPQLEGILEVSDLDDGGQGLMWREVNKCSLALQKIFPGYKINLAALGNVVSQLHIHLVVRHDEDAAWPGPVWGKGEAEPYDIAVLETRVENLRRKLGVEV